MRTLTPSVLSVRAYLDALQNELIEQNKEVDAAMLAETTTEGRTALANKAGKAATENTYKKCKALLQEMRAYQKAGNFEQPFTPSDLNTETKGLKVSITYAQDALATDPVTPDQPGTPEQPGKPEQPGTPEQPEQPAKPEQPTTKPEKPGKSDNTTTTVTTNKTNTKGGLPTTGDRFDGRMVAVFAIAGVAVISAGGYYPLSPQQGVIASAGAGGTARVSPARSARLFDRRETPSEIFSKKISQYTLRCAIVQRNSN